MQGLTKRHLERGDTPASSGGFRRVAAGFATEGKEWSSVDSSISRMKKCLRNFKKKWHGFWCSF